MRSRRGSWLALLALIGWGPCGPIPGGTLSGERYVGSEPAWEDWQDDRAPFPCEIEVRPERPHSVQAECFSQQAALHVAAPDGSEKVWARELEVDSRARVRIDGLVYERRARRVATDASKPKLWTFRLDPRSAYRGDGEVEIGEILRSETKRYSQHDEELVIRDFFRDRRDGLFVDVGAWLPKKNSTTYYLEHHLGWSGIAIDALKEMGPGFANHRPRSRFFNFIVTDHSGGIETLFSAGAVSTTNEAFLEGIPLGNRQARPVQVPTITLDDLLDREQVESIHFLSMDIEGGEPKALAGFDIERFRPELVCIEVGRSDRPDAVAGYFADHGYVQILAYIEADRVNAYFAPRKTE